jgi:hypothetical protein
MSEDDQRTCQLQQALETQGGFLESHEQFAVAIQPGVRALDNPTTSPLARVASIGLGLLSPWANVRHVVSLLDGLLCGLAGIAGVSTEILLRG